MFQAGGNVGNGNAGAARRVDKGRRTSERPTDHILILIHEEAVEKVDHGALDVNVAVGPSVSKAGGESVRSFGQGPVPSEARGRVVLV